MKKFNLEISYPVEAHLRKMRSVDRAIENLIGSPCDASGSGFGKRDLVWYGLSKSKIDKLKISLKKLKPFGLEYKITKH